MKTETAVTLARPSVTVLATPRTDLDPIMAGIPWGESFRNGAGLNAVTGNLTGSALQPFEPVQRGGKTSVMHYEFVSNQSEYEREISASTSGKYNIEGIDVSASASYLTKIKYSETSVTLIAKYRSEFAEYALADKYNLTTEAARLMESDPAKFRAAFGDYFLAGAKSGSWFTATYVCSSSDASNMQEFKASFALDAPKVFSAEGAASFKEKAEKLNISVAYDVFAYGHTGTLPPKPKTPDEVIAVLDWFQQHESPVAVRGYLEHYSVLNPLYPSWIDVDPAAFVELQVLYNAYWRLIDRYESCPPAYRAQLQTQFIQVTSDVRANRSRLVDDAEKRKQCARDVTLLLQVFDAVFDRQDFYYAVQKSAKKEPGRDQRIDETGGVQSWLYGFSTYSKSSAVLIQSVVQRYSDSWHIGWRETTLQFGPDQTKLLVGWQVISNWNDGTNGGWWKTTDQIILQNQGGVHVKSLYDRGCDWTVVYYFVESKDYLFGDRATLAPTPEQASGMPAIPNTVVNIPPDGRIYNLGLVPGNLHVYDTNMPPAAQTQYELTIVNVNYWNAVIQPGHTDTYPANNNASYIRNIGPSRLQVLYFPLEMNQEAGEGGMKALAEKKK
ncbi:MAG TPA: hypothetical protein VE783_00765 [Candidatus Limnocylindrales bacterium]|nr:hypothetical protein [Candidatus Limnocylindrales bacterium]